MKPKGELMARLRSRRQREGWVRVEVWVPKDAVAQVRAYVRKLTKQTRTETVAGERK